jgi:hypothetical protein
MGRGSGQLLTRAHHSARSQCTGAPATTTLPQPRGIGACTHPRWRTCPARTAPRTWPSCPRGRRPAAPACARSPRASPAAPPPPLCPRRPARRAAGQRAVAGATWESIGCARGKGRASKKCAGQRRERRIQPISHTHQVDRLVGNDLVHLALARKEVDHRHRLLDVRVEALLDDLRRGGVHVAGKGSYSQQRSASASPPTRSRHLPSRAPAPAAHLDVVVRPPGRLAAVHQARLHDGLGTVKEEHALHVRLRKGRGGGRGRPGWGSWGGGVSWVGRREMGAGRVAAEAMAWGGRAPPSRQQHGQWLQILLPACARTESPMVVNQPSRLFWLRGKPSTRNLLPPLWAIAFLIRFTVTSTCARHEEARQGRRRRERAR